MDQRAEFLIDYAKAHGPVTVRQLYYQAEVHDVPGIGKDENGYAKVQRQVLQLRRDGRLPYWCISDATRWMRKPRTHDSIESALNEAAKSYRRNLWLHSEHQIEVWLEKDALAGVVYPVTAACDVPLMVSRGYTSETFAYEAVEGYASDRRHTILALYDYDRSGHDAAASLREKVQRFADEMGKRVDFKLLGLHGRQVREWGLPTRPHKRATTADRKWPDAVACELDAMPPDDLRALVRDAIEEYLPADELARLTVIEDAERETARQVVESWRGLAR
jgi:hypothetical protein